MDNSLENDPEFQKLKKEMERRRKLTKKLGLKAVISYYPQPLAILILVILGYIYLNINDFDPLAYVVVGLFFALYYVFLIVRRQSKAMLPLEELEAMNLKKEYKSAEIATVDDLSKYTSKRGFYIGAPYLHWFGDGHILTVGETGSGKGVSLIIPNLISPAFALTGTGLFCIDPKGENYAVSKRSLEQNGYDVYRLNPMDTFNLGTNSLNVFDMIDSESPNAVEFCQIIAAALSPVTGRSDIEDHFAERAQSLLLAYMLYMVDVDQRNASFSTLYDYLSLVDEKRIAHLQKMMRNTAFDGAISRIAGGFFSGYTLGGNKEISGVYSNAEKSMKSFIDPRLRKMVNTSEFSLDSFYKKPTALFLIFDVDQLEKSNGFVRVLMSIISSLILKNGSLNKRVLFMLDEFPQLGHIKDIEKGLVTMRSYGLTYHMCIQNLQQMQQNYPKSYKSFFSSPVIKNILHVQDMELCKLLSETTGDSIDVIPMEGGSPHINKRKAVKPEEFYNNSDHHYLFMRGVPNVVKLPKTPYFENPNLAGHWDKNPYHP